MNRRTKLFASLAAVVVLLVVGAPIAAYAYWVTSVQTAVAAKTATMQASLGSASSSVFARSGTQYQAIEMKNTGMTPWLQASFATAVGSSTLGTGATATGRITTAASAASCSVDSTYTGVADRSMLATQSLTLTANLPAPGQTSYVCLRIVAASVVGSTPSGATPPTPTLQLTTTLTPARGNWTTLATAGSTLTSTGWLRCDDSGTRNTQVTIPSTPAGTFRVIREGQSAVDQTITTTATATTLTLQHPGSFLWIGANGAYYATVQYSPNNSVFTDVGVVRMDYSGGFLGGTVRCSA